MPERRKKMKSLIWLKACLIATLSFLILYFLLGFTPDLQLGVMDIKNKLHVLAAELSMVQRIYGSPQKPALMATPQCNALSPCVHLNWPVDSEAISYDIFRDGAELAAGVVGTNYVNTGISNLTDYDYHIVANGFSQAEISDAVAVTTLDCGEALSPLEIGITKINDSLVKSQDRTSEINDRTPVFEGTTNIPYAIIRLEIHSDLVIIAVITANENGYWRWAVPQNLSYGNHVFYVTATDPEDSERVVQISQFFRIIHKESDSEDDEKESGSGENSQAAKSSQNIQPGAGIETPYKEESMKLSIFQPFQLFLEIENAGKQVFQGDVFELKSILSEIDPAVAEQKAQVSYVLINTQGETVYSDESETVILSGVDLGKKIPISLLMKPGKYTVKVEVLSSGYSISQERQFSVKRKPLVFFGGSVDLTYAEIIEKIGWISIIMTVILAFIFLLFLFEYYCSKKGIQINEEDFKKHGLINKINL